MRKYRLVAKKGEGTFSEVLKAQNVNDGNYHAIKCMKNRFESIDQVNNLREIQALRRLSPHEHIISLEEVLYDQPTGRLALVFELMDANLYELIRGRRHYLNAQLIKSYMWQLLKSLDHMHKKGIFHRDIKPENILIESSTDIGRGLKLADFGSCRGIYSKQPYTEYISTRWYRAPECLLTDGYYGPEMDLWGAGCVMFEITSLYPLFPGSNETDQITRIHKVLGTPTQEMLQKFKSKGASHISFDFPQFKGVSLPQLIPHAAGDAVDLLVKLLKYDASERITAREAMKHPYFKETREAEAKKEGIKEENSVGTATLNSTLGGINANPNHKSPNKDNTNGNQYNLQPSTNKALPTINGLQGSSVNFEGSGIKQQNAYSSSSELYQQNQPVVIKNNQLNQKQQVASNNNSLPPISQQTQAKNQFLEQKSTRSLQPQPNSQQSSQGLNNTQKKRKKYRMNYGGNKSGQQTEQVMKAYGVPKSIGGFESSSKILTSDSNKDGNKNMAQNSYSGHPNRHYVQAGKK